MTEPPQEPPQPPQFPQPPEPPGQPEQFGQQPTTSYGYPGGPADPPRKSNAGMITAIVIGAVLVLGGAGTGVYFLTKSDTPSNTASSSSQTKTPSTEPPTQGSGKASTPPTSGASEAPKSGATPPPTSGGGGGGGGGGGTGGADDDAIVSVAQKYAKAVSGKDEAGAKAVTCDNDTGLLYSSAEKVEVVGKPDKYGDDTASINVKISLGGGSEPIDNFPLFMDKKNNAWCISN